MRQKLFPYLSTMLLLCMFTVIGTCQEKQRRPDRYLIPDGYVGWVKVFRKVKDAPPIAIEKGFNLYKFPPSGILKTSSDIDEGWATDEYFYYTDDTLKPLSTSGWGEGGMIWGGYVGRKESAMMGESSTDQIPEENKTYYMGFFVGTEEQFKKCGFLKDENYDNKVGPLDKTALQACMKE